MTRRASLLYAAIGLGVSLVAFGSRASHANDCRNVGDKLRSEFGAIASDLNAVTVDLGPSGLSSTDTAKRTLRGTGQKLANLAHEIEGLSLAGSVASEATACRDAALTLANTLEALFNAVDREDPISADLNVAKLRTNRQELATRVDNIERKCAE